MSDHESGEEEAGGQQPWGEPTQSATPPPNPWGQASGPTSPAPPPGPQNPPPGSQNPPPGPQNPPPGPQYPAPGSGAPAAPNQWGAPPPQAQSGFPAPPGAGPAQYGQFAAPGVSPFSESSQADVALGLSIAGALSLFITFCCAPIGVFALIACGAGAFLGHREITAIDAGRRDPSKRGNAVAARIIGAIGVVLCVLGIIGFGILIAVG